VRRPTIPPVLRDRNFARYLAAVTVSSLGGGMATVALAFAVLDFGNITDLAIVLLAREVPLIIFVLLGGVYADRMRRRTLLVGTDLIKAATQGLTAVLLFTGSADVALVGLLQVAFGTARAFSAPATTGLVRELAPDDQLQDANALLHLSRSVFSIAGPAIGALIVAAGSPALALAADAVSFLGSAVLTYSLRLGGVVRVASASVIEDLRGGWREFVSRPWAVAMVASFGLFQLTYFPALTVLGPAVAKSDLGGAPAWGTILALESVGAVIGGLIALRIKTVRPLVWCELLVIPAGFLLIGLAVPLSVVALAIWSMVVGVGFASGNTLWETALQRNVPEHALSRISSFDWLGSVALNPLGYALIGPVAAVLGPPLALAVCGVLNIAVCIGVCFVPSVRAIGMDNPSTIASPQPSRTPVG
jgi:hypothetical protein